MRIKHLRTWSVAALASAGALWAACGGSSIEQPLSSDGISVTDLALKHVSSPTACGTGSDLVSIVNATASSDDGNPASNAIDGSLTTRWECKGTGCYLTADLGSLRQVNALDVAWYQGNKHVYPFSLSFSSDGTTFANSLSSQSTGTSTQYERYTFATVTARYVRLTVGTSPASVREIRAIGPVACSDGGSTGSTDGGTTGGTTGGTDAGTTSGGSTGSTDAGTTTGGTTGGSTGSTDAGTTTGGTSGGSTDAGTTTGGTSGGSTGAQVDPFGVTEIYPTKSSGETWFETNPTNDPRFNPQNTITKNADGSYKMTSTQVRMEVFTSTGYQPSLIKTYNRETLANQGYMQSPNDWKNIEMTGFVKVNATPTLTDNFSWYSRGGRHSDSIACEGSSYKGGLTFDGRTRWEKESWHVNYDQTSYKATTSSLLGRWVGFKAVMHNTTVNGVPAVNLQLWLNDNADKVTWTKVYDYTDSGQLGGNATYCGGNVADAIPITWGGPITTFRWDSATDVDFKWLSVREIQ